MAPGTVAIDSSRYRAAVTPALDPDRQKGLTLWVPDRRLLATLMALVRDDVLK